MVIHPAGCSNTGSGLFISSIHTIPNQHTPFSLLHESWEPTAGIEQEKLKGLRADPLCWTGPRCGVTTAGPHVGGPQLTQHHSLSQRMAFPALQWGWPLPGQVKWCWKQLQTPQLLTHVVVQSRPEGA